MSRRRVFVTGFGVVSPHGDDPDAMFDRLYAGESAIRKVYLGTEDFGGHALLAPVDFDPGELIPKAQRLFMARVSQMVVVAAHRALETAGLLVDDRGPEGAGVFVGCGMGGSEIIEDGMRDYFVRRRRKGRPTRVPMIMANAPASHISMRFRLRGPTLTYSVACASSAVAAGEAFRQIRDGYLDSALVGGTEAMLLDSSICAWESLGVTAKEHPDGAEHSSRPFDADRSGFVLGEGAAVLLLESEEAVAARGARPLGEVVGYGASSDAHNLTEPHRDGQVSAMRAALADGDVEAEAVGYVNAHATGTDVGDVVEIEAVKETFGGHARSLAVSATKSMHGHLVGAAGALELLITVLAVAKGKVPPTASLTNPDPECDLDLVPLQGREAPGLEWAVSNSFAFGGTNATVVVRKV